MKIIIFVAFLAGALAFSVNDVDFENLVPIYETKEWQAAFPQFADLAKVVAATEKAKPLSEQRNGRVWGGRDAAPGELPYQVGIVVLLSQQALCGGSIVSSNYVLSGASCFPGDPNSVVEIGHVQRNSVTQFINAAQKIIHPAFEASNSNNDIALVRLVVPITFSAGVNAVRLPNRRQITQTFENQQARISGWGATGLGGGPVNSLRVGFGQVISQAACRIRFPSSSSDRTLCIDGSNVNFCSGDFGGPVTVQDADGITTQIGVASFINVLGCTLGWPGGFTRVSFYLDWIGQNSDVVIRESF